MSESVINWIGMMESGGRRIQRSISIDMTSIRFCDDAFMEKLGNAPHVKNFIRQNSGKKNIQGKEMHKGTNLETASTTTNLSLFKEYLENYCSVHPGIQANMFSMVRLLQSSERGLPIEITVFSKFQQADAYEALQSEIFNHILAILPEFELRIFQNPSGNL